MMVGKGQVNTKDFYMQDTVNAFVYCFHGSEWPGRKSNQCHRSTIRGLSGTCSCTPAESDPGDEESVMRACTAVPEDNSGPSILVRWFTTTCNSAPGNLRPSSDLCRPLLAQTQMRIHKQNKIKTQIILTLVCD